MASETLEEKKPDEGTPSEQKEQVEASEEPKDEKEIEEKVTEKRQRKGSSAFTEPVTPIERPARERKLVERYSVPSSEKVSATKGLNIQKGRGTQLRDIPNVAFKLSKRKPDENLQMLHTVLFGKRTKSHSLKRNIHQFSGFVWVENEEKQRAKVREKLDKCVKEKLLDFCDVLDIPVTKTTIKKDELLGKLLEFLEFPHATTEVSLADKGQKRKKRKQKTSTRTGTAFREASFEPRKKQKQSVEAKKKQKHPSEAEDEVEDDVESADTKGHSDGDDDAATMQKQESAQGDGESSREEVKTKEVKESKKGSSKKSIKGGSEAKSRVEDTPTKSENSLKSEKRPAKSIKEPTKSLKSPEKSLKIDSSFVSEKGVASDDNISGAHAKPKGLTKNQKRNEKKTQKSQSAFSENKKTSKKQRSKSGVKLSGKKEEPSRDEMHAAVSVILKEVDFNTATLSDILRQLETQFHMDLMHRKSEVKSIIEEVINSMTDEEDDGEEADEDAGEADNGSEEADESNDD